MKTLQTIIPLLTILLSCLQLDAQEDTIRHITTRSTFEAWEDTITYSRLEAQKDTIIQTRLEVPKSAMSHTVSRPNPLQFGLATARSNEDRFWALCRAHQEAERLHTNVDYSGVGDITIAIPRDALSIPLTDSNDFQGITITVVNRTKDFTLFASSAESLELKVPMDVINSGDYYLIDTLRRGTKMLIIQDTKPWAERVGHSYFFNRKDILLIRNGISDSRTAFPYAKHTSNAKCWLVDVRDDKPCYVKNLTIRREKNSDYKTSMIALTCRHNVRLDNITVVTPYDGGKYGDAIIKLEDCTNIRLHNVMIDGSYSRSDMFGYGIAANNVRNLQLVNVKSSNCKWSVIGANNLFNTTLDSCNINGFNILCHGSDVTMCNTLFRDNDIEFTSVGGLIYYSHCTFHNCVPLYLRPGYNALVPFDVVMKDCTMEAEKLRQRTAIMDMGQISTLTNNRPELSQKCWPNVTIQNMTIKTGIGTKEVDLFYLEGGFNSPHPLAYCSKIIIEGLMVEGPAKKLRICNGDDIRFQNTVKLNLRYRNTFKSNFELDNNLNLDAQFNYIE